MAYSPSLESPTIQQPISKREKRKLVMEERLNDIISTFAEHRDAFYRKQLQAFQVDIDFIRNVSLYGNAPLEEFEEEPPEEDTASVAASNHGSARGARLGANAATFVEQINNAIEQRDADLTTVAYRHNFRIDELLKDNEFNVAVAHQEHQQLQESLRRRLVLQLNQKKATLQKEKEKLDIADTNALLLHPNQFSLNNAASPGGPQSNRKTRHTRHRLEVEDMDVASGNNKRKRRAPADAENGSPAPAGRDVEPINVFKEANAKLEYHQVTAPLYSLDRLFSQRELDTNLQLATYDVISDFKHRKLNHDTQPNLNTLIGTNVDASDLEDADPDLDAEGAAEDVFLGAPEMERGATNASQHITRSSRILNPSNGVSGRGGLGDMAGRTAGAALIGTFSISQREKKREDDYQRAPPLTDQEQEDDMAMIRGAIEDDESGKLANGNLLEEVVEDREDYVGTGSPEESAAEDED